MDISGHSKHDKFQQVTTLKQSPAKLLKNVNSTDKRRSPFEFSKRPDKC